MLKDYNIEILRFSEFKGKAHKNNIDMEDLIRKILYSRTQRNIFFGDKVHFISYGNMRYNYAKNRIFNEAYNTNWFYSINVYSEYNLSESFKNEFSDILSHKRGGGYWIWKFYIIIKKLNKIEEGEFLIYNDAGCIVNKHGSNMLNDYINLLKNSKFDIIKFKGKELKKCGLQKKYLILLIYP